MTEERFPRTPENVEPSADRPPAGETGVWRGMLLRSLFEPRRTLALRKMGEHLCQSVVAAALGDSHGAQLHTEAAQAYGDVVKLCDAAMGEP